MTPLNISIVVAIVTDLIAMTVLADALYHRRHRRRDVLLSYVALNVGVLGRTKVLELDLFRETTLVDVRYNAPEAQHRSTTHLDIRSAVRLPSRRSLRA